MEGRVLAGRYELRQRAGSDWLAFDRELEREVLLRPADETTAASLLADPDAPRVFDQVEADGEHYVVLEYADESSPAPAEVEEPTLIQRPARGGRRKLGLLALAAALGLVVAGIGAAIVLTGDSTPAGTTADLSVPIPTGTSTVETTPPSAPTTTTMPSTETIAPATTAPPTTAPITVPTTEPPPLATTEPLPTTEPPPTTTEPPPTTATTVETP